jgi:hypothetical protein
MGGLAEKQRARGCAAPLLNRRRWRTGAFPAMRAAAREPMWLRGGPEMARAPGLSALLPCVAGCSRIS